MSPLILVLLLATTPAHPSPDAPTDVAAEVERGVKAYNAHDLGYYQNFLTDGATYIAEDGAVIAGKDRVLRLFKRIFDSTPARQLAVVDVVTGSKGDIAWARFKWTLTVGTDVRKGVTTTIFTRHEGSWQGVQIQNTPDGHGMSAGERH